ncbi:MAG: hypothetical protein JW709_03160 [Sedimentisphaerales bacterium]|nr:hypothetical protein [Sedimentisphaerales bacterium]
MKYNNQIYPLVGQAVHMSQMLELNLSVLTFIINHHFHAHIDAEKLLYQSDKKTLGTLLRKLNHHCDLDNLSNSIYEDALKRRNHIVHSLFKHDSRALMGKEAFDKTVSKLKEDIRIIAKASGMAEQVVKYFCTQLNINTKDIIIPQNI